MSRTDYKSMAAGVKALTNGIPYPIANLANIAAVLYHTIEDVNWAGFYLVEDGALVLGPFQGQTACIRIERGRGVCGTAYERDEIQVVKDVHEFPGHIACDAASESEIVVPFHKNGVVAGVIDIDSPKKNTFDENDAKGLAAIAGIIEGFL